MATYTCSYVIPGAGRGGRLTGNGLGSSAPQMVARDVLQVSLQWAGSPSSAPDTLTGYFVISPSQGAPPAQASPSPFKDGSNYRCLLTQVANRASGQGGVTYNFPGLIYFGGLPGNYELTFIAETGTGTLTPTQWSADPEFDTSS
jgi:hypothetical protein